MFAGTVIGKMSAIGWNTRILHHPLHRSADFVDTNRVSLEPDFIWRRPGNSGSGNVKWMVGLGTPGWSFLGVHFGLRRLAHNFGLTGLTSLKFSSKMYDKRDDFDTVNFPFSDGDISHATSYGVYISQLIRFARVSSNVADFNTRNQILTAKLSTSLRLGIKI